MWIATGKVAPDAQAGECTRSISARHVSGLAEPGANGVVGSVSDVQACGDAGLRVTGSSPMAGADAAEPHTAASVFDRLASRKLVIVSGKGGVGRTTIAALLGVALADRGRRVLVATTGHDDRLAWMLGAQSLLEEPRAVTEELHIQRLDPQVCLREYGGLVLRSARLSTAVFDNRVVRPLLRAIPGLDDFALIGKAWHEAVRGGQYDVVVFDGPATGHLLYALGVPLAILHTVPQGPLTKEAERMQASFEDPQVTQAVLVGLPEAWPLTELGELGTALRQSLQINIASVFVNGVLPADAPQLVPPASEHDPQGLVSTVLTRVGQIGRIGRRHREQVDAWRRSEAGQAIASGTVEVPWRWEGLSDLSAIRSLLAALESDTVGLQEASE
jgi:anion-transporting  ArsA/GET3 family ATPase